MKQYKLIKTYPGSPIEGTLAFYREDMCDYKIDSYLFSPMTVNLIENNPEFWQEVKEYPKIISFRSTKSMSTIYSLTSDGFYTWNKLKYTLNEMFNDKIGVTNGFYEIYQVAKSETEVFTIGDKVRYNKKCNYVSFIIHNFFYDINENRILARSDIKYSAIVEDVTTIEKVKTPLFITEDGIELYNNTDRVFGVLPKANWQINYYGEEGIPIEYLVLKSAREKTPWKYFSTKENAEKYIDKNKPLFSKKQIEDILKEKGFIGTDVLKQKLGI
jgi:hypothetical protein